MMCRGSAGYSASAEEATEARPAWAWPVATLLRGRLQRSEPSQRKERYIRDALLLKVFYEPVFVPVCHVVKVLHANYLRNRLTLRQLRGIDIAQADMTNQSLVLQLGQRSQRFFDGPL
jgi:hypothetical protein